MSNILYDALLGSQTGSERVFLSTGAGEKITYAQFTSMVEELSTSLVVWGVKPGDRVAAQIEKSPWALALYLAVVRSGAVYLPLNTAYTASEIAFFLGDCSPVCLFVDPSRAPAYAETGVGGDTRMFSLAPDGSGDWRKVSDGALPPIVARSGDELAALLYTSGTTGRPKGAMLSHDNLLSNARTLVDLWGFTDSDVLLHALPIYHSHGLFVASNVLMLAGGEMIFLPGFTPEAVMAALPRATSMMGVPTFYTRLLDQPEFGREMTRNVRLFISGSAPLLPQTHAAFEAATGHRILERYGLTETSMNTSNPLNGERRAGTVGFPLPGITLRIRDEATGKQCAAGEIGEIQVKGPNVSQGYWRLPEETKKSRTEDNFFATGDLGFIDADGYVTISGRSKDLIISGGLNVYPREVEEILDAQPGVLESAVIGVPDADFGERVVAIIVPQFDTPPDANELHKALSQQLAKFKLPKQYHIVAELPRNALGKVQKNLMRDQFKG